MKIKKSNMFTSKKTAVILFSLLFLTFISASFSFAEGQSQPLEVDYPEIGDIGVPESTSIGLPSYIKYVFNFSLMIAGLIAFGSIIYGGIRYLTSAGNPSKMSDGKERVFAAILGIFILLGSYLILTTINPRLRILNPQDLDNIVEKVTVVGVNLCIPTEDGEKKCQSYGGSSASLGELNDKISYVEFNSSKNLDFGIVLHEKNGFKGRCAVCLDGNCQAEIEKVDGVSSVTIFFRADSSSGEGVTLYEEKEYNAGCDPDECERWPDSDGYKNRINYELGEEGKSMKMTGKYIAIIETDDRNRCEVFKASDADLGNNYIGICKIWRNVGCLGYITVLPIK